MRNLPINAGQNITGLINTVQARLISACLGIVGSGAVCQANAAALHSAHQWNIGN
jgi:hypothetical protein